ncbi:unnamed protein product [Allacma fusca]|uniref:SID1 transmembrane family member 1 n=1 Tax=Allacma fusca TaxID=39272 RepID=A0A8J2P623_9HEXA|nr:unnamed protein product [Allacma fusca]
MELNLTHKYLVTVTTLCTVAKTNTLYQEEISADASFLYVFPLRFWQERKPESTNIRVEVGLEQDMGPLSMDCPVLFVINQEEYVTSMELPFRFSTVSGKGSSNVYYEASRTLCVPEPDKPAMRNITVRVTTCRKSAIKYNLKVSVTWDYLLPLENAMTIQISPTRPIIHGYLFSPQNLSSVKISATSTDSTCMTISIQPLHCPIFDQEWNVNYVGLWQTMTKKAAMTIENNGRFSNGFAVALVVHDDDQRCRKNSATKERFQRFRWKTVKLRISDDSQIPGYILFFCLILPVVGSLAIVFVTFILFRNQISAIDVTDSYASRRFLRPNVLASDSEEVDPLNSPLPQG